MSAPNTTFIDPTLPLVSIFSSYGINQRQVEKRVPLLAPMYDISTLAKISEFLGKPELIESDTPLFEVYRKPLSNPAATIATRTSSGSDLVITWTNPAFRSIRERHMVVSKSKCIGYVKFVAAGTATISFFLNPNGNTSFTASDFAVGNLVTDLGEVTDRDNRLESETLFTMPVPYTNIVGSTSDSVKMNASEAKQVTFLMNSNGTQYYAQQKVIEFLARARQQHSVNLYQDIPKNLDTAKPVGASAINQVKTMGGISRSLNAHLDENEFVSALEQLSNNGGLSGSKVAILGGFGYCKDFQLALKPYVTTAGKNNVLNDMKGLDIWEYHIGGYDITLMLDPVLQNPNLFQQSDLFAGSTQQSYSALWFDPSPVKTVTGSTMAAIQDYYYISADMIVSEIGGMTDMNGNPRKTSTTVKLASQMELNWNKTTQITNPAGAMWHYAGA